MRTLKSIISVISLIVPTFLLAQSQPALQTLPGIPPVPDPRNVYSETVTGKMSPATTGALSRVYVPNLKSSDVYVIDPATFQVVDHFKVGGTTGANPQHVIPSWDLKTLW